MRETTQPFFNNKNHEFEHFTKSQILCHPFCRDWTFFWCPPDGMSSSLYWKMSLLLPWLSDEIISKHSHYWISFCSIALIFLRLFMFTCFFFLLHHYNFILLMCKCKTTGDFLFYDRKIAILNSINPSTSNAFFSAQKAT